MDLLISAAFPFKKVKSILIEKNNTAVGYRDDDLVNEVINETCTCGKWQEYYQCPCIHAIGRWILIYRRMEIELIIDQYVSKLDRNPTQQEITK